MSEYPEGLHYASLGQDGLEPRVTIAIPTYNRPDLLIQSIESAARQDTSVPYEIVVSDNCSDPDSMASVRDYLRSYRGPPLRYYSNTSNVGMFGNWNLCLTRARADLVTILSDDDLLLPEFLSKMVAEMDRKPVGCIICQARILDQRDVKHGLTKRMLDVLKIQIRGFLRFGLRRRRPVTLKRLFWGNVAGSSLGCVFRRREAIAMGGFDEHEYPSADLGLHIKFARTSGMDQIADLLCVVRLGANESAKPSTLHGFVTVYYKMRKALLEAGEVPASWAHWAQYLLAYEIGVMRKHWGGQVQPEAIEADLGVKVPHALPSGLMWWLRAGHGGV